jgi:hypothetical protein
MFPAELLDSFQAQSFRGALDMSGKWVENVLKKADEEVLVVDENFNVLVVSKFLPEDVQKYLEEEVPLANCQPIVVTQDGTQIGTHSSRTLKSTLDSAFSRVMYRALTSENLC